ncbi:MAG: serine hydrolase domain-containing protein [Vicinamibacterales bacterium]|nr:serine hydrolase domain-containing protein [Vicinamibacterales bacterium]MDP6608853.1 serine hydrolase domain-containing protein [Vicinamibacterales bacterium]
MILPLPSDLGRCAVAAACLAVASTASAQTVPDQGTILDTLGEIRRATGAPGVTAAVAVDGEVIFSGGVGWAELENQAPAAGVTVHNVASISKAMTAVATLQLVEQEALGLDDRIREHLPALSENVDAVTIRHLLTHTAGLRNTYALSSRTVDGLVEAIVADGPQGQLFAPGELWSYSSAGFNLLQAVIESVSGLDFEVYMQTRVWEPAGMPRSALDVQSRIVPRRGRGYARDDEGNRVNAAFQDLPSLWAAGGMLSTAGDLARLGVAINAGVLLEDSTVAQMHEVRIGPVMEFVEGGPPRARGFSQALGWRVATDAGGRTYINHSGAIRGVGSILINYPDDDLVIALIANIQPFDTRTHGEALAQIFFDDDSERREGGPDTDASVGVALVDPFLGRRPPGFSTAGTDFVDACSVD